MILRYSADSVEKLAVDTLVVFIPAFEKKIPASLKMLDSASGGAITTLLKSGEFLGREEQLAAILRPRGFKAERVILCGLGEAGKLTPDSVRRVTGAVSRHKGLASSKSAAFLVTGHPDESFYQAAIEGYLLGSFEINDYKASREKKNENSLATIVMAAPDAAGLKRVRPATERGRIIAEGQLLVRRLASAPANYLTPRLFAREAMKLARRHRLDCKVLDEKAIARERMGALLGVAKGSSEPPRFIILTYRGGKVGQKPIVLVGKGVTFDSGGISLKEALNMSEMKGDMAGAAVVLAALIAASRLKLPLNLVGLMPATENMPSGTATRPGDILRTRKGITVEVINTDAEGRLILADALDYANRFKPQAVIDIATLTGAALYILGYAGAPIIGNNRALIERVKVASEATAEKVWELPIWDEHREQMKSSIADLVNSGGKPAGTIAAASFLERFVGEWPWVHIDIAFVDVEPKGKPYVPKGATGFGLRLLVELLSNWKRPV